LNQRCIIVTVFLTEIDQEGVITADTDPAQEMGDESVEVFI